MVGRLRVGLGLTGHQPHARRGHQAAEQQPGQSPHHEPEEQRVYHRFGEHQDEDPGLDRPAATDIAHHQRRARAEEQEAECDQPLPATQADEEALQQDVGAVPHAEDGVVGEGEGEQLVEKEERQGEQEAMPGRT